jgi:hypothetical protein
MEKKNQVGTLISVVVVLLAALAVGVGVRKVRLQQAKPEPPVQRQQSKPVAVRAKEDAKPTDMTKQDEEFLQWVGQETTQAEEGQTLVEEQSVPQQGPEVAVVQEQPAPLEQPGQMAQGFGDWRNMWSDLNLTEEEQVRLREGFAMAMQRWQNMSEEDRQAEAARMRAGWERWQNMSDQERQQVMQRMREQFEEWRRSGRIELPVPSLD